MDIQLPAAVQTLKGSADNSETQLIHGSYAGVVRISNTGNSDNTELDVVRSPNTRVLLSQTLATCDKLVLYIYYNRLGLLYYKRRTLVT